MKMFSTIRQKWILFLERIKREFVNSDEVFYIGGTDVLPPPLEKTQENMCIIALSNNRKNDNRIFLLLHILDLLYIWQKSLRIQGF